MNGRSNGHTARCPTMLAQELIQLVGLAQKRDPERITGADVVNVRQKTP